MQSKLSQLNINTKIVFSLCLHQVSSDQNWSINILKYLTKYNRQIKRKKKKTHDNHIAEPTKSVVDMHFQIRIGRGYGAVICCR